MNLFKRKDQNLEPEFKLLPSLQSVVDAEGLDAQSLTIGIPETGPQRAALPRTNVIIGDEEKVATWTVTSLRELFRGEAVPPDLKKYPPEYAPYFLFIEKHVIGLCHAIGNRTDQQMEEIFAMLRRRPDGRSLGPDHDYLWQVCALMLGMHPLSQAQFEGIIGRLEQSARTWALRPVSRNYASYLHKQFGC